METYTQWLVQRWDAKYELWNTLRVAPAEGFNPPVYDFGDEAAAVARRDQLRSERPDQTYRAVRSVTTNYEVA